MVDRIASVPSLCFALFLLLLSCSQGHAEESDGRQLTFVNPDVSATTNIHFNKYYCSECHLTADGGQYLKLRFDNYTQTCRCHNYTPETYTHPVGISLPPEKRKKIPADFPLKNGRITCATCHVMSLQCQADNSVKKFNRSFLRVNPRPSRTAICFRCHNEAKYRMMDPHNQIDEDGSIIKAKCLYCHKRLPDVNRATLDPLQGLEELVAPIGKLDVLCYRCHFKQVKLHPINANHLKKPPPRILNNIRRSERKLGIIMPLDAQGKITCVTCHNPHERGVIQQGKAGAGGAGEAGRLRVSKNGDKICLACHRNN